MSKENKQKKKVQEKSSDEKLGEVTDLLQRTQASFENFRKQTESRVKEMAKMASKDVILQILPIVDNFELALKSCDVEKNQKDFCEGVELIHSQLKTMLENNDIKQIETIGKSFDPYFHEALMKVPSTKNEGVIIEEFAKGYTLNGHVIRHAKVKVSAGEVKVEEKVSSN
jgi:molecular chaperone GrpE